MPSPFFDILTKGIRAGQIPAKTAASINWYRNQALNAGKVNRQKLIANQSEPRRSKTANRNLEIGSLYLYNYDPKLKLTLDVYDTHPLVVPFTILKDRFYACNFHYLPHKERAQLMDILHGLTNNDKYDETTKIKLTYQVLKKVASHKLYKPTIHCYLKKHIKSKLMYIYPTEWDTALFLPVAKFKGPQAWRYTNH